MSKVSAERDRELLAVMEKAAIARQTCFAIETDDAGVTFSWGTDPLDYIWQSYAQTIDLLTKLNAAVQSRLTDERTA